MSFQTTDLCDAHEGKVSVVEPMFQSYGGRTAFAGRISTIRCFEDNSLVREALSKPGSGKVLVVDGGGSLRCALLGDQLAALAERHRWEGIVVYGCIRDSEAIGRLAIGVRALTTHPMKSVKKGMGDADVPITFGGVTFQPGHHLYADADGIIVSETPIT